MNSAAPSRVLQKLHGTRENSAPTLLKTPPYAKRLEGKLDLLVKSKVPKKTAQHQSRLESQVAKLSAINKELLADNSRLKAELQDFRALQQLHATVIEENHHLKSKSQGLLEENAALESKMSALTQEVRVYRDIVYKTNKHSKKHKKRKKRSKSCDSSDSSDSE